MNKELKLSYDILKNVYLDKSYSSIELNKVLTNVSDVNTMLITKIVYGVLEKDITLEYFVSKFVKRKPRPEILLLLKMVAYVSKWLNSIPPFALVNEIVNISKTIDSHQSGFVNATSKQIIAKPITLPSKSDFVKYLSIKHSYPEWIVSQLIKTHDKTVVEELIAKDLTTLTHIRVNTQAISAVDFRAKLQSLGIEYVDSLYDYTMYVDYGKLIKQDIASNEYVVQGLPSIIVCNMMNVDGGRVLDACASPGGKSVLLAQGKAKEIFACDIHGHRVDLIRKYAKNYDISNIKYFVQDATKERPDWIGKFEYVLCDVPCSNLGVTRKKPDVLLNKTPNDISTLAGVQYQILENCAKYVSRGGILMYSTCTLLDKENIDVINRFLNNNKDFELTQIAVPELNLVCKGGGYTFFPHLTNTEGFFIGRLKRK